MHDSFLLGNSLQNGEVSHLVTAWTAPGLLPAGSVWRSWRLWVGCLKELEALGWLVIVEELEVVGCRVPLGDTKRIRLTRKTRPPRKCPPPCWKSANTKAVETVADTEVKRLVFWCLPSSLRWVGRLALPLVLTALVLAEGLGAARTQVPGLAKCQGCLARLC